MKHLNYILQGFGYENLNDFNTTVFKAFYTVDFKILLTISFALGTVREFIEATMGLDILVLGSFVFLIIAEWQTGIKADIKIRKGKIESRKIGRMILKIGVYMTILFVLFTFASRTKTVEFIGFDINPLGWLYYVVFVAIVFQLVISWFENLGVLGYKEARGIVGIILRRYNKWFDFDGSKDVDEKFKNLE